MYFFGTSSGVLSTTEIGFQNIVASFFRSFLLKAFQVDLLLTVQQRAYARMFVTTGLYFVGETAAWLLPVWRKAFPPSSSNDPLFDSCCLSDRSKTFTRVFHSLVYTNYLMHCSQNSSLATQYLFWVSSITVTICYLFCQEPWRKRLPPLFPSPAKSESLYRNAFLGLHHQPCSVNPNRFDTIAVSF